jgi:hypothetical protein
VHAPSAQAWAGPHEPLEVQVWIPSLPTAPSLTLAHWCEPGAQTPPQIVAGRRAGAAVVYGKQWFAPPSAAVGHSIGALHCPLLHVS